jgi:hypothetical protein
MDGKRDVRRLRQSTRTIPHAPCPVPAAHRIEGAVSSACRKRETRRQERSSALKPHEHALTVASCPAISPGDHDRRATNGGAFAAVGSGVLG